MKTEALNKWRFQLLLLIMLGLYAVIPFFERRLLTDLAATAVAVFAVSSVIEKRGLLVVFSVLAALVIAGTWYANLFPDHTLSVAVHFLDALFQSLIVGAILSHVFRSTRITRETIAGAICVYLLIGGVWAHVFSIVETVAPNSFSNNYIEAEAMPGPKPIRDQTDRLAYFSFVTLATLGYGDIVPLTQPAKNLAVLEAICGQLYLAVLIARLIGQQVRPDKENED